METSFINTLHPDASWKEKALSKTEIIFDDSRNSGMSEFNDELDNFLEYGKSYKFTIKVEEYVKQ